MLTGVNFEQAIDYWKKGREVIVIDRNSKTESGGYDNFPFEELFRNVELLANVPAVENPEFSQTVDEMAHGRGQKREEPSGEGKPSTPPPPPPPPPPAEGGRPGAEGGRPSRGGKTSPPPPPLSKAGGE